MNLLFFYNDLADINKEHINRLQEYMTFSTKESAMQPSTEYDLLKKEIV